MLIGVDPLGERSKLRCPRDFLEQVYRSATRCRETEADFSAETLSTVRHAILRVQCVK